MNHCILTLKPYGFERTVSRLDIRFQFDSLPCKDGETLCLMLLSTVSVPCCPPEQLIITDQSGTVPYVQHDSEEYPDMLRHYTIQRELTGEVAVSYTVCPRPLKPQDVCGPYIDFRTEDGGANAGGVSFLLVFPEYEGEVSLKWDMSHMPAGSKGVCAFGEGDFTGRCSMGQLRDCYFAMGDIHSISEGEFGVYWLSEPAFDIEAIARYTQKLFAVMNRFFRDSDPVYRIFVRKDPYSHSGGSAMQRSYMFGWNDTEPVSLEGKQNILAHELVHNWPRLKDEPYGAATWYTEGSAEYYSVLLPLRAGLISCETALKEIQSRTDSYYTNPLRHMGNTEAAALYWQKRAAQEMPYGRGFFFLANIDAKMRRATDGKVSVDDVVLRLLQAGREGISPDNEMFLTAVKELSGLDVREDWEQMCSGVHFVPLPDSFDGHFTVQEKPAEEAGTGKPAVSYSWSLVIK